MDQNKIFISTQSKTEQHKKHKHLGLKNSLTKISYLSIVLKGAPNCSYSTVAILEPETYSTSIPRIDT